MPGNLVLLATAIVHVVDGDDIKHKGRMLLDNASESSFITKELVERLTLKTTNCRWDIGGVGGIGTSSNSMATLTIQSRKSNYKLTINCGVLNTIAQDSPSHYFDKTSMQLPPFVNLADDTFNIPGKIDILLGSEFTFASLKKGQIRVGTRITGNEVRMGVWRSTEHYDTLSPQNLQHCN